MEQQDKGIDITTYKFGSQDEPPTPSEKFDTPEEKFDTPEEGLENLAIAE
jgi:hypothetical protein